MLTPIILIIVALFVFWLYWRYIWFFRDPERQIPPGKTVVSPADGVVVYVKKVKHNHIPVSQKKGRMIPLKEDLKMLTRGEKYLVGVFMNPLSVHVNRAPISGRVVHVRHYKHKNLVMTLMWLRTVLNIRPFYRYCEHMWENERNIILIDGVFPLYVVQIADLVVNKVECWIHHGQHVEKGERIGMIKFGSQVDVAFPSKGIHIVVKEGDRVTAGESVLARY